MLHNPTQSHHSDPSDRDPKPTTTSFTARLFASVMDFPGLCLALLVLLTGLAMGGYLDPDWPEKLKSRWFPNSADAGIASGESSATANSSAARDSNAPRRFGRRGGFGNRGGRS